VWPALQTAQPLPVKAPPLAALLPGAAHPLADGAGALICGQDALARGGNDLGRGNQLLGILQRSERVATSIKLRQPRQQSQHRQAARGDGDSAGGPPGGKPSPTLGRLAGVEPNRALARGRRRVAERSRVQPVESPCSRRRCPARWSWRLSAAIERLSEVQRGKQEASRLGFWQPLPHGGSPGGAPRPGRRRRSRCPTRAQAPLYSRHPQADRCTFYKWCLMSHIDRSAASFRCCAVWIAVLAAQSAVFCCFVTRCCSRLCPCLWPDARWQPRRLYLHAWLAPAVQRAAR
jgi:hypothetical protein